MFMSPLDPPIAPAGFVSPRKMESFRLCMIYNPSTQLPSRMLECLRILNCMWSTVQGEPFIPWEIFTLVMIMPPLWNSLATSPLSKLPWSPIDSCVYLWDGPIQSRYFKAMLPLYFRMNQKLHHLSWIISPFWDWRHIICERIRLMKQYWKTQGLGDSYGSISRMSVVYFTISSMWELHFLAIESG